MKYPSIRKKSTTPSVPKYSNLGWDETHRHVQIHCSRMCLILPHVQIRCPRMCLILSYVQIRFLECVSSRLMLRFVVLGCVSSHFRLLYFRTDGPVTQY